MKICCRALPAIFFGLAFSTQGTFFPTSLPTQDGFPDCTACALGFLDETDSCNFIEDHCKCLNTPGCDLSAANLIPDECTANSDCYQINQAICSSYNIPDICAALSNSPTLNPSPSPTLNYTFPTSLPTQNGFPDCTACALAVLNEADSCNFIKDHCDCIADNGCNLLEENLIPEGCTADCYQINAAICSSYNISEICDALDSDSPDSDSTESESTDSDSTESADENDSSLSPSQAPLNPTLDGNGIFPDCSECALDVLDSPLVDSCTFIKTYCDCLDAPECNLKEENLMPEECPDHCYLANQAICGTYICDELNDQSSSRDSDGNNPSSSPTATLNYRDLADGIVPDSITTEHYDN